MADYDIVVLGATGVTGREIARHLAEHAGDRRWAIAGRSPERMADVQTTLGLDVPAITVDVTDPAQVVRLAQSTDLVINAIGAYSTVGAGIWSACALAGTDQVDLCADIWWLAEAISLAREQAAASGSRIVHSAGFLSLPFDLATLAVAEEMRSRFETALQSIDFAIEVQPDSTILNITDVMSSGTMSSSLEVFRRGGDLVARDVKMLDPNPHDALPYETSARQHERTNQWLSPMMPTPYVNPTVVHRTASMHADTGLFAPSFRFRDGLVTTGAMPGVPDSMTAAWVAGAQFMGSMLGAAPEPMRNLMADSFEAFLPKSSGPSEQAMSGWNWALRARSVGASGDVIDLDVLGDGHLGYRSSAQLATETALWLLDEDIPAGVHTPGTAVGTAGIDRFRRAGMELRFDPERDPGSTATP